ncbi:hypothetical protein ILYODFUR_022724 [Ilyodon furcidens]|uniref:Uncharacterized protein n=1 Tax=Ilyodon furcidens TaxID=33524 RepID=A0ABV0U9C3_9TELE
MTNLTKLHISFSAYVISELQPIAAVNGYKAEDILDRLHICKAYTETYLFKRWMSIFKAISGNSNDNCICVLSRTTSILLGEVTLAEANSLFSPFKVHQD